jgi:hypothetical protein
VHHFIQKAIFLSDTVDFIVIANNRNLPIQNLTIPDYVKVYERENVGYDFGGWSFALSKTDLQAYTHFIFANSSIVGPFLKDTSIKWTDIFVRALYLYDVKIIGPTINAILHFKEQNYSMAHVQSYLFCIDRNILELLIKHEIFSVTNVAKTFFNAIFDKEVKMSMIVRSFGFNIGCFVPEYKGFDFTFQNKTKKLLYSDIMFPMYRNVHWNEYDLVFIKGNRVPNVVVTNCVPALNV